MYDQYPNATYIYVEEGISVRMDEYVKDNMINDEIEKSFIDKGKVYLTDTSYLDTALKIDEHKSCDKAVELLKEELEQLPDDIDMIVFTEPMIEDYGDILYQDRVENSLVGLEM